MKTTGSQTVKLMLKFLILHKELTFIHITHSKRTKFTGFSCNLERSNTKTEKMLI